MREVVARAGWRVCEDVLLPALWGHLTGRAAGPGDDPGQLAGLLLAVRFTEILIPKLAGMPRNIVLESLAVAGISAAIYIPIRNLPLLGDQKSQLFMLLCAIPTLLHSLYSALADHAERVRKLETQ